MACTGLMQTCLAIYLRPFLTTNMDLTYEITA
jgi:hypothetical protein